MDIPGTGLLCALAQLWDGGTPAFSPVPVDLQADCHLSHTRSDDVMRIFGFCIHEAPEVALFHLGFAFAFLVIKYLFLHSTEVTKAAKIGMWNNYIILFGSAHAFRDSKHTLPGYI